jgi:hypothetical protein
MPPSESDVPPSQRRVIFRLTNICSDSAKFRDFGARHAVRRRRVNGQCRIDDDAVTHESMCREAMKMASQAQLTHIANVEDDSTGEAFEVFGYTRIGGRRDRLLVDREVADDPKQVRLRLRKYNAALSPRIDESMREVKKAISTEPLGLLRHSAGTGWLADDSGFVTAWGTIDSKRRRRRILPPLRLGPVLS